MAALSSTPSSHLLSNLSRPTPTTPYAFLSSSLFFKPLPFRSKTTPLRCPSSSFFSFTSLSNSNSETLLHVTDQHEYEAIDELDDDDNDEEPETENEDVDSEEEEEEEEEKIVSQEGSEKVLKASVSEASKLLLPSLTVKEKKELASYAHSLGKKLKSQQVGKSGVTDSVAIALIETLESNELLKLKIHGSCPGELDDVVKQLEKSTGSVVVGKIGRTVILYRPSLTKMKAEEKKMQARRAYVRKPLRPSLPNKGQLPRLSGRGRRGSSRVPSMSGSDFP